MIAGHFYAFDLLTNGSKYVKLGVIDILLIF